MGLHAVAVESALADPKDPERSEKAAPHIKELIGCTVPALPGAGAPVPGGDRPRASRGDRRNEPQALDGPAPAPVLQQQQQQQAKLRASALNHLKIAATQLPDVAEAQARYGVALILAKEPGLGRQYLQNAVRQGNLDPQYQIWAAWSMVQAGYPEEAEPIVAHLFEEIAEGRQPRDPRGDAPPAQRRDPPGPAHARGAEEGGRRVRALDRRRPARQRGRPAPPGPDRGPARPARRRP